MSPQRVSASCHVWGDPVFINAFLSDWIALSRVDIALRYRGPNKRGKAPLLSSQPRSVVRCCGVPVSARTMRKAVAPALTTLVVRATAWIWRVNNSRLTKI